MNLNVKYLQFQYIGLKFGFYINYLVIKFIDCDMYDL